MESTLRRTWAEIDLDALAHNYQTLRQRTGTRFVGVVKADAYGHGSVQVSRTLEELGADYLAVSSLDETMELRAGGYPYAHSDSGPYAAGAGGGAAALPHHAGGDLRGQGTGVQRRAVRCGGTLKIHIKVDTGMSRLGFLCGGDHFETGVAGICAACTLPGLEAEGIFTHFAVSDEADAESDAYTRGQFDLFCRVIGAVEQRLGRRFPLRHCANTGAVARWPETYLDMVRPGLLLYGCGEFAGQLGLRPVMTLKTTVSTIKVYEPGTSVSYGRRFVTDRTTRMGVVPYGYAGGFFRCLSDRWQMMTAEGPAPQRGRICMDMCMIDLTDRPSVDVGDEVEIFGPDNSVNDMAEQAGTIPYELTCAVSKRVPRIYLRQGQEIARELLLRF